MGSVHTCFLLGRCDYPRRSSEEARHSDHRAHNQISTLNSWNNYSWYEEKPAFSFYSRRAFLCCSAPLVVGLLSPFIKPFSLRRIFFSTVIPLIPVRWRCRLWRQNQEIAERLLTPLFSSSWFASMDLYLLFVPTLSQNSVTWSTTWRSSSLQHLAITYFMWSGSDVVFCTRWIWLIYWHIREERNKSMRLLDTKGSLHRLAHYSADSLCASPGALSDRKKKVLKL